MTDYKEDWDIATKDGSLRFAGAIYSRLVGGEQDESELLWLAEYLRVNSTTLAQPEPEGVTDEEWEALKDRLLDRHKIVGYQGEVFIYDRDFDVALDDVRQELARWGRPAIEPVPVSERFEFSVFNSEYEEQAGGTAPTYAEALGYGQHYLSQYSQDGPHSLEIRRVEVLPRHTLPLPTP